MHSNFLLPALEQMFAPGWASTYICRSLADEQASSSLYTNTE